GRGDFALSLERHIHLRERQFHVQPTVHVYQQQHCVAHFQYEPGGDNRCYCHCDLFSGGPDSDVDHSRESLHYENHNIGSNRNRNGGVLMNRSQRTSGQSLLLATVSLSVIFGMIGLTVDLGWAYYRREAAQAAADAAVLAAVHGAAVTSPSGFV